VVHARIVGTFQYGYVGPIKETPVHGDPHVHKIATMQMGYGWEGLWDKQITKISDSVFSLAKASNRSMKPTAALQNKFSVFATTPCRGLFLSR
jgi:hypothetical protein